MDTKQCVKCGEIKQLDLFAKGRNVCKKCRSKQQLESSKKQSLIAEGIKSNKKQESAIKSNNILSNVDIAGIKEILRYKEEILLITKGIKSNNEGIKGNNEAIKSNNYIKGDRNKATYNIDIAVVEALEAYCKASLYNKSDIVNIAIMQYLQQGNKK